MRVRRRRNLHGPPRGPRGHRKPAKARPSRKDTRVTIGGALDSSERAAHTAAAQALAGGPVNVASPVAASTVHRACSDCEKEEKQAKRSAGPTPKIAPGTRQAKADSAASSAIRSMGSGESLAPAERAFFEPRFGKDLSHVKVHDGPAADRAAKGIDARAFAWGSDIAFAAGERERGGKELMAHELAHVVADGPGNAARREVHRATMATVDGAAPYKKVPAGHRPTVQKALNIIEKALTAKRCRDFFKDKCSGGALDSAKKAFDGATVFFKSDKTNEFGLSDTRNSAADPRTVAYNQRAFDIGRWEIATTLTHEMFHTCILGAIANEEIVAEQAAETCGFYSPWVLSALPKKLKVGDTLSISGFQLSANQDAEHFIEMGGQSIANYDQWEQPAGGSSVEVKFKVPAAVLPAGMAADVPVVAVNHGIRSNTAAVRVEP